MSLSHSVDVATVVVPRLEANDLGGLTGRVRTVRSEVASHWWRLAAVTTFRHNIFRLFPAVSDISASFVCFTVQRPTHISSVCRASSVHCTTTATPSQTCRIANRTSQLNHIPKRSWGLEAPACSEPDLYVAHPWRPYLPIRHWQIYIEITSFSRYDDDLSDVS